MHASLIDHIVKTYAFTVEEKRQLANTLAQGYLQAKTQAYQRAQSHAGHIVQIRHPWQVSESDVKKSQQWALSQVQSIAETYETLLRHMLEQLPEERAAENIIGKVRGVISSIIDWINGFLPWKVKQVADNTWNTGDNDGTEQWIDDVQSDDIEGDTSTIFLKVVPEGSSSDYCADFAGRTFALGDEIPHFPAHVGCIHSIEVITASERMVNVSRNVQPERFLVGVWGV